MTVKNLASNSLSAILAVLVVLSSSTSHCVALALIPVRKRSLLAKNLSKKWGRIGQYNKKQILQQMQIIINLILGILLTHYCAYYHSYLIKTIVTLSFQLNFLCLNWAIDLPDYSTHLNHSELFAVVTHSLCVLFGYLGLSTQICFTLDLVALIAYPFRLMKWVCEAMLQRAVLVKNYLIDVLTIPHKQWVTCPYPQHLLADTYKLIYICALPLTYFIVTLVHVYSCVMVCVNAVFEAIISSGSNFAWLIEQIGSGIVGLVGLQIVDESLCVSRMSMAEKYRLLRSKINQTHWQSMAAFDPTEQQKHDGSKREPLGMECGLKFISILKVYQMFTHYLN